MLTVTEVAKQFSVSRQTVLKWIKTGKIKAVKVVKVYRIPKEEIERLLAHREAEKGRLGEMKDKDLTWDIVNSELKGHRLFERYCWLNSCCEECNKKVRFWCKLKDRLIKHQEKIITKSLNKRATHPTEKGGGSDA